MSSSLGGGISGSGNSRGSRPSAAHARTRLSLPLDDSDNDIPFMPTPSTMSHTRTRKPFDLDSDDESLPATVLNGSYLDDNMSAVSYHRSRHGSIDDRQKDRESERVRQRELGRQENSRSRNRPRDHQRDIDRNEREDSHGARSSMGGGFVAPYPEQYDMPTGGSYDYYDNKATPHPPQPQDNYHQELLAPQQGANYRQRASPAPEREKPRSSHQASIANETGYQSDRHSRRRDQEADAPSLPPRPDSRTARSISRPRESSRHRDRSRRNSSNHRDVSRSRHGSSSKSRPSTYSSHLGYGEEDAIASSDDEEFDGHSGHKSHGHRLSVSHPEDEERRRRRSSGTGARPDIPKAHGALLAEDVDGHHRASRSHSRSRSVTHLANRSLLTIDNSGSSRRHARRHSSVSLAAPSPMLEPYRGTWQESSPMPSPILRNGPRQQLDSQIPEMSLNESPPEQPRRARFFHDATDYTVQIANAIKDSRRPPDTATLIEVLPGLTSEQVAELSQEYRKMVTVGPQAKGVNVAKHIKMRLKDCEPNLAKACYLVTLGPWAGDSYWANFWYHGDKTRHELLIESLMGRTNAEIRKIKDSFRDKRYDNSLVRCMKAELKEDKFKKAVLMVLDEGRMEDKDPEGRLMNIDLHQLNKDIRTLRKSILSPSGGETAMLKIILKRNDDYLKIILTEYERSYESNFARDALKKCGNLVGEVIAHVLNGLINKPVRDAILLHHAITSSRDPVRNELLISRLVRFHWDSAHMEETKRQFFFRYKTEISESLRAHIPGEFGRFCRELCISRVPNSIITIKRVSELQREHSEREAAEKDMARLRQGM
ncbi:hypothetical protein HOO65_010362 [Ceratocystis lukuohia]|uniref:Annexin ANXC4 n=1 Tax=Ceratocystis lukuohia TaxID=2019550 RepID=A0ABR4MS24_9PEZI